jgi:uncharacterized protein (TIGR02599 family)
MRSLSPRRKSGPLAAFTLIEVMITVAILIAILVGVLEVVSSVERSWKAEASDSFASAQEAFSVMTQNLATATLEPYQDFADSSGTFRTSSTATFVPDHLARRSDLAFVCGPTSGANGLLASSGRVTAGCGVFFAMPQGYTQTEENSGMEHLLNAMGYFVEFGTDSNTPSFLSATAQRWRWRLKEIRQPSESLQIFNLTSSYAWIQQLVSSQTTTPALADNIIALVILPERAANDSGTPLASDFRYDSRDATTPLTRNQLPTRLRVAIMAIDEASAQTLAAQNGSNPPALVAANLFQKAAQLDNDLATLDGALTSLKIRHRLFQREILVTTSAWSNTLSQ